MAFTHSPLCPDATCMRRMIQTTELQFDCPRCSTRIVFPTSKQLEQRKSFRAGEANAFAQSFPTLRQAFDGWISGDAYYTKQGYRLKSNKGRIAPWSKTARKFYPECSDFHEAAHAVCQKD